MENSQVVYMNTLAEGALIGNPEEITSKQLPAVARTWKKSAAVAHYRLFGTEFVSLRGERKKFLIGDIGSAKIILPMDEEYSGVAAADNPERLLNYWISAVIDDFDLEDEADPVLILNRKKAIERLKEINARRVVEGARVYGVIQAEIRGGYIMNVGGFQALMPRSFYDWDTGLVGHIGEGFNVQVVSIGDNGPLVSRRDLLPNPFHAVGDRIQRGARVRARITHVYNGLFKAEIRPGVRISISTPRMYRLLHVGDEVMVEVKGKNRREFYGVVI
ncbi:4-hydroxy-3-methylbut-2-enyl diphosphate reductase [Alicyclobacillus mengziensis]|uniref:4-hydroxy-3-methylbut-2-enyl diphosphate reductase n=1 Tax=Alicyclobacillus mengziensis TaxID=2931921 RepID=A0A9X7Z8Y7_9BACL|nr:4-hydroxy-3-methylbut-2-enyl diphosphate reductase [Alicyclobacillus mengziensis]QSO48766.1 4-hydroxy-3-methylbut-2-enyl diphosphate reductase [Alicyclobacillus mengziensis]